ncbi:hypothetical protein BO71DRAFT_281152, partial [Aspergillus ellipticus CBS 707.79]
RTRHTSRASFACERCKKTKRRCDIAQQNTTRSACTTCLRRKEKCEVRQPGEDKRSGRRRSRKTEIRARIAALKKEIRSLASQTRTVDENEHAEVSSDDFSDYISRPRSRSHHPEQQLHSPVPQIRENLPIPVSSSSISSANSSQKREIGSRNDKVPSSPHAKRRMPKKSTSTTSKQFPIGMDEVTPPAGMLKSNESGNQRYFGASSMSPYSENQSPPPRHAIAEYLTNRGRLSPSMLEDFIETEPIVTHLLDLFWAYQASHLIIIDRDIFMRHRKLAQEGDGVGDRNFYTPCLRYAILALASMISTDKGVRRYSAPSGGITGDEFSQRARVLFEIEMETPTVTTVQTAILLGARYGTLADSCLGWTFSGIALRMATRLGLHLDCSGVVAMGQMSEGTAQNRLVAFWGLYVEDKLFSAYCQRPTMLMDWDITISPPGDQPLAKPYMSPHLMSWTVSLYKLCGKTLLGLYAQRHYNNKNDGLKKVAAEIHRELWEWQQNLPSDLTWLASDTAASASPPVLVLHMQFYYNLILLHRPFLEFSKVRREISQDRNAPTNSTTTCAIAAANIARIVRDYRENYNIRQISGNPVHIVFIAATIHLINLRLTNTECHDQLLQDCIPALTELGDSYPIAKKALDILHSLIERF